MPFFDDSGPRVEDERGLFWRSTSLIGDQLERMVALNITWALQTAPLLAAWAVPNLPGGLRLALVFYSALALIPATAVLFDVLVRTNEGIPLSPELAWESLKAQFVPSLLKLLPLYSLFYWLGLAAWWAGQNAWLWLDVLARLLLLLAALLSLYWGSLFVRRPQLAAHTILLQSARLFWRRPGPTLLAALLSLLTLAIGIVSIGGMFLIVPVLLVLIQVQLYATIPQMKRG